jgi:trk system potassium uptake protein TrkA
MQIVILGAGEVGYHTAMMLSSEHDVTIIERDPQRCERASQLDVKVVEGDGTYLSTLKEAEIEKADLFLALSGKDEVNLLSSTIAKRFNVPRVLARVEEPEHIGELQSVLGIDRIVCPDLILVSEVSRTIAMPQAIAQEIFGEGKVRMIEVLVEKGSRFCGVIKEQKLPSGIIFAAIFRDGEIIIPRGDDEIKPGDKLIILGNSEAVDELKKEIKIHERGKIVIAGGGVAGEHLARLLEKNHDIKIFDIDRNRCEELSKKLKSALVLCADVTDPMIFDEENLGNADALIAVADNDEKNLLISLLAKEHGVKKTIVRVNRSEYLPIFERLGISMVISPRIATAREVVRLVRRENVTKSILLEGGEAELMEILIPENSPISKKLLKDADLPRGVLIGAIIRGERVIIPKGEDYLQPGDRAIILSRVELYPRIKKLIFG